MAKTTPEQNKVLVLEAFDTLFNKRDYAAAERFWSPDYIQHSAHIAPGREGLFNLIKSIPPTLKYEAGTILAEGDFVIVHGRFSDFGAPVNWTAADIVRIEAGKLAEHWDVIQDEATKEQSKSGAHVRNDIPDLRPEDAPVMTAVPLIAFPLDVFWCSTMPISVSPDILILCRSKSVESLKVLAKLTAFVAPDFQSEYRSMFSIKLESDFGKNSKYVQETSESQEDNGKYEFLD